MNWLLRLFRSSVMVKIVMAVTGLGILGFLLAHLAGNLLIFGGAEKINAYGQGLRDLGPLLWALRGGMLVCFGAHIWSAIVLADRNRTARPVGYKEKKSLKSTLYSRTMMMSGLTVLAFVSFHLLHYTFGLIQPEHFGADYRLHNGRITHDVYSMVLYGFQNPFYTIIYILCMILVGWHLSHAVSSMFQTFGLNNPKYSGFLGKLGPAVALIIVLAYLSIPTAVMIGVLKHEPANAQAALKTGEIKEMKR